MSDDVRIQITTDANLTGAKQTAEAMEKVQSATAKAADETARYNQALRQMEIASKKAVQEQRRATDESERYQQTLERMAAEKSSSGSLNPMKDDDGWLKGVAERRAAIRGRIKDQEALAQAEASGAKEINGTAESLDKATIKTRDLREAFRHLGEQIPIVGIAGRMALNPFVGLFTAVAAGLGAFKRGMDDAIERMNTGVFKGSFRQSVDEIGKAALDADLAFSQFKRSLDNAAQSEESLKGKTSAAVAVLKEQAVAQAELDNARKAVELAAVNYDEAGGKISAPEAIQKRLAINQRYQREADMARYRAQEDELEAKRKYAKDVTKLAATTEQEAAQAKLEMEAADQDKAKYDALMQGSREALKSVEEQIKALKGSTFFTPSMKTQLRAAWDLRTQLQTRIDVMEGDGFGYADRAAAARDRWTQASSRAVGLRKESGEIGASLPREEQAANARYVTQGRAEAANRLAQTYEAAATVAKGAGDVRNQLTQALQQGTMVQAETVAAVQQWAQAQQALAAKVRQLEDMGRAQTSAVRNMR